MPPTLFDSRAQPASADQARATAAAVASAVSTLGPALAAPVARLQSLDQRRWGRFRRSHPDVLPPAVPTATTSARWLPALARASAGPYGRELVPVVLRGLSLMAGSCDLNDDEHRLPVQVLPLLASRFARLRSQAAAATAGAARGSLAQRLGRMRALYGTWLALRDRGARRAGTEGAESYLGCRGARRGPTESRRSFTWFKLADLVYFGVHDQLQSVGAQRLSVLFSEGRWEDLLEIGGLACLFGEGRTWAELQAVVQQGAGPEGAAALVSQVRAIVDRLEPGFRRVCTVDQLSLALVELPLQAHRSRVSSPPSADALGRALRTHREQGLREAEAWLERRWSRVARGTVDPEEAWAGLRDALQQVVEGIEGSSGSVATVADASTRLDRAIEDARASLRSMPEFPWWPGDGEEYRIRRQRSAAAGDRMVHLIGLAERVLWALGSVPATSAQGLRLARERMEQHEAGMFIEEWTSRYGSRLGEVFVVGRAVPSLAPNRAIRAVDRAVHQLVASARRAGARPEDWGWLFTGCTDRLREVVRREGSKGPTALAVQQLLEAGDHERAHVRILATGLPGFQPADLTVPVTVAVHVYHADPDTVRQNLLRGKHVDWRWDVLRRHLGSSSSDPQVVEAERRICLETGTTHAFLSARRHKKAGNQNRLMANAPVDARGRGHYLTLDDDFHVGSQLLQRAVVLAERHPRAAHVQLPMYLYGNDLPGISRARYADAAGMAIWGAWTSPGLRDLRLFPDAFDGRRPLALPFGTCTLLRLDPAHSALPDTNGFHTDSVTEDFAQGQVAFGMRYAHHPRKPENDFEDGILLDEVWAAGDGVELLGRVAQQTRWAEGSIRNALTIWSPVLLASVKRAVGLHPAPGAPTPSLLQLLFGTLLFFGYGLELISMMLLLLGFPLTAFIAEPTGLLVHSFAFWGGLWAVHMLFHGWMAAHAGMSVRTFLDQHFLRFAAIGGIARGIYRAVLEPSRVWAANKTTDARLPSSTRLLYLGVAAVNLLGLVVGLARGMDVYLLCVAGLTTALWPFLFLDAVPVEVGTRVGNLPRRNPRARAAAWLMRRQAPRLSVDDRPSPSVPGAQVATGIVAVLTVCALATRYWSMGDDFTGLFHRAPLFIAWLVASDLCQLAALGWLWFLAVAGMRNQPVFQWSSLMAAAGQRGAESAPAPPREEVSDWRRVVGNVGAWLVGRRPLSPALGFVGGSGLALVVPAVALGLRVVQLEANSAFMDESFYIITGQRILAGGDASALLEVMFGTQLYPLFAAWCHSLGGLWGARLGSAILGALTALAVAQVGERLGGRMVALAAGLACAVLPQHIYLSALAMYDVAAVFWLAVALALIATVLRAPRAHQPRETVIAGVLAAAGFAGLLATLSKYVAAPLLPALAVAIVLWSRGRSTSTVFNRVLAFAGPASFGGLLYAATHAERLQRWWAFATRYGTLVVEDPDVLWRIYVVDGRDILLLLALGLLGAVRLIQQRSSENTRDLAVFVVGCASFALFQFLSRADWNYGKHVTFALPYLLPLAGLGIVVASRKVVALAAGRGVPRLTARRLVYGTVVLGMGWLGLRGVDRVDGALRWWPDTRTQVSALAHSLPFGSWVLTDDTGAELGLSDAGFRVDTPYFAAAGFGRREPVAAGLWEQRYDAVLLTGGVTLEGQALNRKLGLLLPAAGYRQVAGEAPLPDGSGLWLRSPRAEPPSLVVAAQGTSMR